MNFLFDENFGQLVAPALSVLGTPNQDVFRHILDLAPQGTADDDIPALCRDNQCRVLLTLNYKDFGAKKVLYQALLADGVSVVVVRPGKLKMSDANQVSIVAAAYPRFSDAIRQGNDPILVRATMTDVVVRHLDELIEEIQHGARLP